MVAGAVLCLQGSGCATAVFTANTALAVILIIVGVLSYRLGRFYGIMASIVATVLLLDLTWAGVVGGSVALVGGIWMLLAPRSSRQYFRE